jgi:hypothetical protein
LGVRFLFFAPPVVGDAAPVVGDAAPVVEDAAGELSLQPILKYLHIRLSLLAVSLLDALPIFKEIYIYPK